MKKRNRVIAFSTFRISLFMMYQIAELEQYLNLQRRHVNTQILSREQELTLRYLCTRMIMRRVQIDLLRHFEVLQQIVEGLEISETYLPLWRASLIQLENIPTLSKKFLRNTILVGTILTTNFIQ